MDLGIAIDEVGADGQSRLTRLGMDGVTLIGASNGKRKLYGTSGVLTRLRGIEYAAKDWEPVFARIRKSYRAGEGQLWRTDGAGKWAPLTPKYEAWKSRHGYDTAVMRRTGALEAALVDRGPGSIDTASEDTLTLGTSLHYAVFAQRGSGSRRRRVVTVSTTQRRNWVRWTLDHLESLPDEDVTSL